MSKFLHNKTLTVAEVFLANSRAENQIIISTLSQTMNFILSKLKEFADDNFKFDENG